jgi:MoxR-like ATPase
LRLISGIPVILMGETGIGKTSLIKLMSIIMDCRVRICDIHAGTTSKEIEEFMGEVIDL